MWALKRLVKYYERPGFFLGGEAFPIESSISILFTQIFAYHLQRNGVATGEQHESEFGKHSAGYTFDLPKCARIFI